MRHLSVVPLDLYNGSLSKKQCEEALARGEQLILCAKPRGSTGFNRSMIWEEWNGHWPELDSPGSFWQSRTAKQKPARGGLYRAIDRSLYHHYHKVSCYQTCVRTHKPGRSTTRRVVNKLRPTPRRLLSIPSET